LQSCSLEIMRAPKGPDLNNRGRKPGENRKLPS
jgi:hypothetical protein